MSGSEVTQEMLDSPVGVRGSVPSPSPEQEVNNTVSSEWLVQ